MGDAVSDHGFYPESVYKNVPKYLLVIIISFLSLSTLSILLIQPFEGEKFDTIPKKEENPGLDCNENIFIHDDLAGDNSSEDEYGNIRLDNNLNTGLAVKDASTINTPDLDQTNPSIKKVVKLRRAIFSKQNIQFFILGLTSYCKIIYFIIIYLIIIYSKIIFFTLNLILISK